MPNTVSRFVGAVRAVGVVMLLNLPKRATRPNQAPQPMQHPMPFPLSPCSPVAMLPHPIPDGGTDTGVKELSNMFRRSRSSRARDT